MPLCLILSVALVSLIGPSSTPAAEAGTGSTLEQVLSAPFPSDLVASPAGGAVACEGRDGRLVERTETSRELRRFSEELVAALHSQHAI